MPVYVYQCEDCRYRFEVNRKISELDEKVTCPVCGGEECRRVYTGFSTRTSDEVCPPSRFTG